MGMSIWLHRHPLFHVPVNGTSACLAIALRTHRDLYSHLAARGLHCLDDFLTPNRTWPMLAELSSFLLDYLDTYDRAERPRSFNYFYSRITLVAHNVCDFLGIPRSAPMPPCRGEHLPTELPINGTPRAFYEWPRSYICNITHHAPVLSKPHPLKTNSRDTLSLIHRYTRRVVSPQLSILPPIYSDVWWRVLYRVLPVNYTYFFLQQSNPRIMECSYPNCCDVETQQHVLFDCPAIHQVWSLHQRAWASFGQILTWHKFMNMDEFPLTPQWRAYADILQPLWTLLVGTTLRELWYAETEPSLNPNHRPTSQPSYKSLWSHGVQVCAVGYGKRASIASKKSEFFRSYPT